MRKLLTRLISGLVYVALILGCYFCGPVWFFILMYIVGCVGLVELTRISGHVDNARRVVTLCDMICMAMLMLVIGMHWPVWTWVLSIMLRLVVQIYIKHDNPLSMLSESMFKHIYIGVGLGCAVSLSFRHNPLLAILIFIWLNDTCAYGAGTLLGRHRMFPRLSPKKSWEGFCGGLIFTMASSVVMCLCFPAFFGLGHDMLFWLGLSALTVVMSTWGDLVESMIKRSLHIKDAGKIIPGHGGVMDRIDSLLMAVPSAWIYISLLG